IENLKQFKDLALKILATHNDLSHAVKLEVELEIPLLKKSLKSELSYRQVYPLKIILQKTHNVLESFLEFSIAYSSTCPQSAALSKEVFIQQLSQKSSKEEILDFIEQNGLLATPHAQRSQLDVTIKLKTQNSEDLFLMDWAQGLIEKLEQSLGTPTQGFVKRVDEQQFAVLNAQNLMFCEDAARRIFLCLGEEKLLEGFWGKVSHFESLHSHDAVAYFSKI
ncbi:MAG: GTP cyclohydrolase, FolE2/MptA family, partial [Bdellovibrionaceae bacterium]|nr:GTP cyclohydrolase, FolE2/MptA family [Pseudobdellovibrionaceae bacterium]